METRKPRTEEHMGVRRWGIVAVFGMVALALASQGAVADTAARYLPPDKDIDPAKKVRLVADKRHGFAPMTVSLSGMIETKAGSLIPMNGGQTLRLVIEEPFLSVQSSVTLSGRYSDLHYESSMYGPKRPMPFHREIQLRKPGRYMFRLEVTGADGRLLSSNEVSVKAL
jgi:hypothetical protein